MKRQFIFYTIIAALIVLMTIPVGFTPYDDSIELRNQNTDGDRQLIVPIPMLCNAQPVFYIPYAGHGGDNIFGMSLFSARVHGAG